MLSVGFTKIRVFTSLLCALCLLNTALAQKAPEKRNFEIKPDESEEYFHHNDMRLSMETGLPLAIYRAKYLVTPDSPEKMAQQYLKGNVPLLGLDNSDLSDLHHHATRSSQVGHTVRYRQTYMGLPVNKAEVTVNISPKNVVNNVANGYRTGVRLPDILPSISETEAKQIAYSHIGVSGNISFEKSQLMVYHNKGVSRLAYQFNVLSAVPLGEWEVYVDAKTKEIFKAVDVAAYHSKEEGKSCSHGKAAKKSDNKGAVSVVVDGIGNVFDPDPLSSATATYGTPPGLSDNNDADTPELNAQLQSKTLLEIDLTAGVYSLVGPYAEVVDFDPPATGLFTQATDDFSYNRGDDPFEAVNTYYHIDYSMRYINDTLNCPLTAYQYAGGIQFDPQGASSADNSYYSSGSGQLSFGEGCVDDAEDSDVIHHELGHGIHDWITNGGLSQVDGLSEGSGDYWAQSYNRHKGYWTSGDPAYNYVFNWDGHNDCWPGRITNYTAAYPAGLTGSIHTDGQIWATCMMQVWDLVGRQETDKIFLMGLGMTNSNSSQNDAANAVFQAALDLNYTQTDIVNIHTTLTNCGYTLPEIQGPPVANISADATLVCLDNGGVVNFTDESGGIPSAWSWTFSGGTPATSTLENPTVTYAAVGTYDVSLTVTNADGTDSQTFAGFITVVSGTDCPSCNTYTSTDIPVVIDGAAPNTITSTLTIPSGADISDVNVVNLTGLHTYVSDLTITLTSPAGTSVDLFSGICGTDDDFNLTFDDDAPAGTIPCPPTGGGNHQPTGSLASFNGESPVGTWTLTVADAYAVDGGSLDSWGIEVCALFPLTCSLNLTSSSDVDNCGNNMATATATPGGGTAPYTYLWDAAAGNQTTQTATGLGAGTYNVVVTDNTGCQDNISVTVTGGAAISVTTSENAPNTCNGGSDGAITTLVNGGTSPYTYDWSGSIQDVANPFSVPAGTHTVIVTDAVGCTMTSSVTVSEPTAITTSFNTTPDNCSNKDGTATVLASGGTISLDYTYLWNADADNQTTSTATGLASGTYTVTVTDLNNCSVTATTTVAAIAGPTVTSSATLATCNTTTGTATATPSGGTAPFTYLWDAAAGNQTTQTATNLGVGSYSVTVTDANNCAVPSVVSVSDDCTGCALSATTSSSNSTCAGACDGTATAIPSNGTAPFGYLWSTGQTGATLTGLCAGTYTVTVADVATCITVTTVTITEPSALSIATTSTSTTCAGNDGTATAQPTGGTAPYSYQWSDGSNAQTAVNLPTGVFTITCFDNNGCSATQTVNIIDGCGCNISATATAQAATCVGNDGSVTAQPTGGTAPFTYLWDMGATTQTVNNLTIGSYSVVITDATGCTTNASAMVSDGCNCALALSMSSTNATCGAASGTATANPFGGTAPFTYLWSNGGTDQTITGLTPGVYTTTTTDAIGCTSISSTSVGDSGTLTAQSSSSNLQCNGDMSGVASIDNAGSFNYIWSNGATTASITGLAAGTYSGTVSQGTCSDVVTFTLTEPPALISNLLPNDNFCTENGGSINASITGGSQPYSYLWNTSATGSGIAGLATGTYTLTVTDFTGCEVVSSTSITSQDNSPVLSSEQTNISCFGDNDGSVTVNVVGGTTPFTYLWNNGLTTPTLNGLPPSSYSVNVTDANGCIAVTSVIISEPTEMNVAFSSIPSTGNDGSASANVSGGVPPYIYQWDNGQTTQTATGLQAGEYTVFITDANGCTIQGVVTVDVNTGIIDLENLTGFELFPNPTDGQFEVSLEFQQLEEGYLHIYNVLAQELVKFELSGTSFNIPVDLRQETSGVYFAIVRTDKGQAVKRFVISK